MPDNRTGVTPQLDPAARPPEVGASLVCTVWDVPSEYYQSSRPEREKRLKKLASSKRLASQNIHLRPVMLAVTAPRLQGGLDVSDTPKLAMYLLFAGVLSTSITSPRLVV